MEQEKPINVNRSTLVNTDIAQKESGWDYKSFMTLPISLGTVNILYDKV